MRCSHCQSMMFETETVKEGLSEQTWFECPTCGRTHLFSRMVRGQEAAENQGNRGRGRVSLSTSSFAPPHISTNHSPSD